MINNGKYIIAYLLTFSFFLQLNCPSKASEEVKEEETRLPFLMPIREEKATEYLEKKNLTVLLPETPAFEAGRPKEECLGLSIDGGGIRGVMPAIWVDYLEKKLAKYKQEGEDEIRIHEVFNCIGGTSIGGILALGLAQGMPAEDLVEFFDKHGRDIFNQEKRSFLQLLDFWGLYTPRYRSDSLKNILQEKFGADLLSAVKTDVLVTAATTSGDPKVFRKDGKKSDRTPIWEVARSSSAAPTYFDAHKLHSKEFIDGGIWCNNPSSLVAARLVHNYPRSDWRKDIHILSLGTGEMPYSSIPGSAGITSAGGIISALMSSHSRGNHIAMQQLFSTRYTRINAYINKVIELDDVGELETLKTEAAKYFRQIDDFIEKHHEIIARKIATKRASQRKTASLKIKGKDS